MSAQFYEDFRAFRAPEGESAREAVDRLMTEVLRLVGQHPTGPSPSSVTAACSAHCFRAFGGFDTLRAPLYMNNAAVTVVDTDGVTFASVRHNDVSHLAGLALARPGTRPKFQFSYRLADARRDEAFIRACGEGSVAGGIRQPAALFKRPVFENARGILEADRRNAFLPLADGRPAGLLLLDSRQDDEAATGHIALVYLLPEYRGMGLGAQLIGRAVIEYRARGMKTLRLNVATVNKPRAAVL